MPQKPIAPKDVTQAIDRLKAKSKHQKRRIILPGHSEEKPKYDWPSITITAIANETECARGTLYSLANENKKAVMTEEEVKLAKRFKRILKPYMRIKSNDKPLPNEPKRNTLEYYKQLAQKRGNELKGYTQERKDMLKNRLKFDDLEAEIENKDEIIYQLKENARVANKDYLDMKKEKEELRRENGSLRHRLMLKENELRRLSQNP